MASVSCLQLQDLPWVQRAAIVLQAKHVPYDITYIDRR